MFLLARTCVSLLVVVAVTGCAQDRSRPIADSGPAGAGATLFPSGTASSDGPRFEAPPPSDPVPAVGPRTSSPPLAPPPGPAEVRTTPTASPAPGTLQTVDWPARVQGDAGCPAARAGAVSYGDLDADGMDEAAVPLTCGPDGGTAEVLVYAGNARSQRLLGSSLAAAAREQVHAVQFRERHLVVTTLAYSSDNRSGKPDTAVTTRWIVRSGALERTDRWTDPAYVLETDEE